MSKCILKRVLTIRGEVGLTSTITSKNVFNTTEEAEEAAAKEQTELITNMDNGAYAINIGGVILRTSGIVAVKFEIRTAGKADVCRYLGCYTGAPRVDIDCDNADPVIPGAKCIKDDDDEEDD